MAYQAMQYALYEKLGNQIMASKQRFDNFMLTPAGYYLPREEKLKRWYDFLESCREPLRLMMHAKYESSIGRQIA